MNKLALVLVLAASIAVAFADDKQLFLEFMQKYNKEYSSDVETARRFRIFQVCRQQNRDTGGSNTVAGKFDGC